MGCRTAFLLHASRIHRNLDIRFPLKKHHRLLIGVRSAGRPRSLTLFAYKGRPDGKRGDYNSSQILRSVATVTTRQIDPVILGVDTRAPNPERYYEKSRSALGYGRTCQPSQSSRPLVITRTTPAVYRRRRSYCSDHKLTRSLRGCTRSQTCRRSYTGRPGQLPSHRSTQNVCEIYLRPRPQ